ncbi:KUP/HAK/KT family potassium transporter [Nocardioides speluncae]|uniref:KUP/HAK/KT family potassium transporter n=1 Tax=Nocardioides speluncae TaxID=2670337 RepID=UPI00197DF361|nr:KUP/HAK/KT family potassium transporter [Nocardioides speluncae]
MLKALLPTYALGFLVNHFGIAFFALAAVVLAVTGAEALYADLGHFGRPAITKAWLILVFPACICSYLGQGALLLQDPSTAGSLTFFRLAPEWGELPLVLLATAATVIASQSVITGAFSVARQAAQIGYLPRLRILHTSAETIGQICVPFVNWALMIGVLILVFSFKTSIALAFAFGMAVTGTVTITTIIFFYYVYTHWKKPLWLVLLGGAFFLSLELLFLGANLTKLAHGAWLPLLIGVVVFTILTTWQRGRALVTQQREAVEGDLQEFVDELHETDPPLPRVPGTAVFLNRGKDTAPLAMRANVDHNRILHEKVLIASIETKNVPHVPDSERVVVDDLEWGDDNIAHVTLFFGYMQEPKIPAALRLAAREPLEFELDVDDVSYFLSTIELKVGDRPGMSKWRKRLFVATSGITADAAEYFGLPRDRTVIMGSQIEV